MASLDSDKSGESSRRPVPTRTLDNPSRLTVAQRLGPRGTAAEESSSTDADTLAHSLLNRVKITKKGERWSDKLMEEAVDIKTFKKACGYLTPRQYLDVLHERHLNGLCSYPTCSNAPLHPYTSHRRFKISTSNRTIREKQGNEEEGYCSDKCRLRSGWVEQKLSEVNVWDRAGKVGVIELLEDLEDQNSTTAQRTKQAPPICAGQPQASPTRSYEAAQPTEPIQPWKERIQTVALNSSTSSSPSSIADMISSLTIIERPSQSISSAPTDCPPTTNGPLSKSKPTPPGASLPTSEVEVSDPDPLTHTSRRNTSSLVSTPGNLTSSVLSASRQMGPIPQLDPDSEDEEVEQGDWGESEMGLDWGDETDEMKALFEEARKARDLLVEAEA